MIEELRVSYFAQVLGTPAPVSDKRIRKAIEGLDLASKPFAQARMNRAIAAGFQGVSLDDAEKLTAKKPEAAK